MMKTKFTTLVFIYAALLALISIVLQVISPERDSALLTPLVFAGIILIMGFMTLRNDLNIFGKHGASALCLIAFIVTVGSFLELGSEEISYAVIGKSLTALISIIFLSLFVKKIGDERRNIEGESGNE